MTATKTLGAQSYTESITWEIVVCWDSSSNAQLPQQPCICCPGVNQSSTCLHPLAFRYSTQKHPVTMEQGLDTVHNLPLSPLSPPTALLQ